MPRSIDDHELTGLVIAHFQESYDFWKVTALQDVDVLINEVKNLLCDHEREHLVDTTTLVIDTEDNDGVLLVGLSCGITVASCVLTTGDFAPPGDEPTAPVDAGIIAALGQILTQINTLTTRVDLLLTAGPTATP